MPVSKEFLAATGAPVPHEAFATRVRDGFTRWFAHCPTCGETRKPSLPGGKEQAEALAKLHNETGRWTR